MGPEAPEGAREEVSGKIGCRLNMLCLMATVESWLVTRSEVTGYGYASVGEPRYYPDKTLFTGMFLSLDYTMS